MPLDLDMMLRPIAPDRPVGAEVRYEPRFDELTAPPKIASEPIVDGRQEAVLEPINWRQRRELALTLARTGHDLRLLVALARAMLATEGASGLAQSLALIRGVLEQYWDDVYPKLDLDQPKPTAAAATRLNALQTLADAQGLVRDLHGMPLVKLPGELKPLTLRTLLDMPFPVASSGQHPELSTAPADIRAARAELTALAALIEAKVGEGEADILEPLAQCLEAVATALTPFTQPNGELQPSATEATTPSAKPKDQRSMAAPTVQLRAPDGQIMGRRDVVSALARILEYYAEHEPASPVPLLLRRAQRLVPMSFEEAIGDLVPEALEKVKQLGGHEPSG